MPVVRNYEREFKAIQMQMKEEENKTKMEEEMIKGLNSDKLKLEQEVAQLKELLVQKEKEAKTSKKAAGHHLPPVENRRNQKNPFKCLFSDEMNEDKNCSLPPMDGYPECQKKIQVT